MPPSRALVVALDLPLRAGDLAFTFAPGAAGAAPRGAGVIVPFGRRLLPGVVLGEGDPRPDLRPVLALVEPSPLIPAVTVELAEWVARTYVSSVGEALSVATPWDALWHGVRLEAGGAPPGPLSGGALRILAALTRRPRSLRDAATLFGASPELMGEVAESGLLRAGRPPTQAPAPAVRTGVAGAQGERPPGRGYRLTSDRSPRAARLADAVRHAMGGGPRALVVAGWPRLSAYLAAVGAGLAAGWSCVALFATTEAAGAFAAAASTAGFRPVLLHGGLPLATRLAAWQGLAGARGTLVVGTRAAIFAPVADPVVAIVDDEDHSGHKEERAPRYLASAVAEQRTRGRGVLIIGATTPPVATYGRVQAGQFSLLPLPSPWCRLGVVDLRRRADPRAAVSQPVLDAVRRTVRGGGRALLLADRRGYAGGLHCAECGAVQRCPRCRLAMAYDRGRRQLICRVCGDAAPAPAVCSACRGTRLYPIGAGTERLAAALRRVVPRVWRFDADALGPGRHPEDILAPFRQRGGALVATTLVLPHLEALRPDLVAMVAADRWLHRPEFRAAERALALLRTLGLLTGALVLVETADPHHPVIRAAGASSLKAFYEDELQVRRTLGYPPYRALAVVEVAARSSQVADDVAARLVASATAGTEVLGPMWMRRSPGPLVRCRFVIKATDRETIASMLVPLMVDRRMPSSARVTADVDPAEL
jgi:primosomal protein N' (replication factor Y)